MRQCIDQVSGGSGAQPHSLINLFSGGRCCLTVFAVGVMPAITASIIVQLLTVVILIGLEQLRKEWSGRAATDDVQYTRYPVRLQLSILQATSTAALAAKRAACCRLRTPTSSVTRASSRWSSSCW